MKIITNGIDTFTNKQGMISSFVVYPLVIVVIFEVFMRYVVNRPTIWGFEMTTFLYGIHFILGYSYTERHSGHVQVDIITSRLSARGQAILGIITYCTIFLPVFILMTIASIKYAHTSTIGRELNSTSWAPPIYPIKIIMALGFLFLVVQGVSTLLKHIQTLTNKSNH